MNLHQTLERNGWHPVMFGGGTAVIVPDNNEVHADRYLACLKSVAASAGYRAFWTGDSIGEGTHCMSMIGFEAL